MAGYILDQTWEREAERLAALERSCDPLTISHLERVGVNAGWRCLEVGGGRGSIARWLADRVGDLGEVLAVDIDTSLLEPHRRPNLEVRRLDILTDALPPAAFDLVHARHVIGHLPDRGTALSRLVTTLRPGGCMLIEEFDYRWTQSGEWPCDPPELSCAFGRIWAKTMGAMRAGSYDGTWSWRVPADLRAAGLTEVGGEGRSLIGDRGYTECMYLTVLRFRDEIIAAGESAADIDGCLDVLADPTTSVAAAPLLSVWGRRPLTRPAAAAPRGGREELPGSATAAAV